MLTRRSIAGAMLAGGGLLIGHRVEAAKVKTKIVAFETSPFPYDGSVPDSGKPFLDTQQGAQRGHTSPRGGVYLVDPTYSDRRVLLAVPPNFHAARGAIVVFLHGNLAELERDVVRRQRVVAQFVASKFNAALVVPQFARDALDSSAGHFWDTRGFARFMAEAEDQLSSMTGQSVEGLAARPIVLVAYSGGYNAAAAIVSRGGVEPRLKGLILLDALYAEEGTFAEWLQRGNGRAFFFSAYSPSSAAGNLALQDDLRTRGLAFEEDLPSVLKPGAIAFRETGPLVHNDFVTQAWTKDPLRDVLARVRV